jgi:hypothetical protein
MQIHHQKHHAAYVANFNIASVKLEEATHKGDISSIISLYVLHSLVECLYMYEYICTHLYLCIYKISVYAYLFMYRHICIHVYNQLHILFALTYICLMLYVGHIHATNIVSLKICVPYSCLTRLVHMLKLRI